MFGEAFDCGWSLLGHGTADIGNLNHIYERELNKPDVHQMKGRWNVSMDGEGQRTSA